MAKKSIEDHVYAINTNHVQIATLLNLIHPIHLTATDAEYLQRTLNVGACFAQAFVRQKPEDFMLWADAWGKCMQYLEVRFGIQEPSY